MLYRSQNALHGMCNAVLDGFERFTLVSIQSRFDSNGSRFRLRHVLSRFDTNRSRFVAKVNWKKYPCESLFIFASHMLAIDWKNVTPEGEKLCLPGGLGTCSTC